MKTIGINTRDFGRIVVVAANIVYVVGDPSGCVIVLTTGNTLSSTDPLETVERRLGLALESDT